jgi:choline dehydrogenase-like flavoprotein
MEDKNMDKKNNNFDYIIVGAGLSGLSLAKELSMRNKKVLLLEKGRTLPYSPYQNIS